LPLWKPACRFFTFFDGFRTSHEVQKISVIEYDDIKKLINWEAVQAFRERAMSPDNPCARHGPEPGRLLPEFRGGQPLLHQYPGVVQDYMNKLGKAVGRQYHLFDYVGHPEAKRVIVTMGSL
jgi:Pyruvate:ferredoxin oxidoreductase and related 2-oxoacid:ferredoxin oxidoreductases, alpha subunit